MLVAGVRHRLGTEDRFASLLKERTPVCCRRGGRAMRAVLFVRDFRLDVPHPGQRCGVRPAVLDKFPGWFDGFTAIVGPWPATPMLARA